MAEKPQKSVQQIMLGSVCTDEEKTLKILQRIKNAGYDAVELNRFMTEPSPFIVRILTKAAGMPIGSSGKLDWKSLLDKSSLAVSAYHTDLGSLEKEPDKIFEETKNYAADRLVITGMYRFDYGSEKSVKELAARLNAAGEKARQNRIRFFYHNHNAELLRTDGGEYAYDILLRETDPEYVSFEFDSYWFADAGASPLFWMEKLGERMKLWHIADRGTRTGKKIMTPILKSDSVELGTGNLPLDELLGQAVKNQAECIVLESHRNWIDGDPVKSIEISAKWLNEHL